MKIVCLTHHSHGLMFLVPVNTVAAAAACLVVSAVTRTSAARWGDGGGGGGGGWGGVLWSVHSNLYFFFSFFCLVWLTFLFKIKNWIKLIYLLLRFTSDIILLLTLAVARQAFRHSLLPHNTFCFVSGQQSTSWKNADILNIPPKSS